MFVDDLVHVFYSTLAEMQGVATRRVQARQAQTMQEALRYCIRCVDMWDPSTVHSHLLQPLAARMCITTADATKLYTLFAMRVASQVRQQCSNLPDEPLRITYPRCSDFTKFAFRRVIANFKVATGQLFEMPERSALAIVQQDIEDTMRRCIADSIAAALERHRAAATAAAVAATAPSETATGAGASTRAASDEASASHGAAGHRSVSTVEATAARTSSAFSPRTYFTPALETAVGTPGRGVAVPAATALNMHPPQQASTGVGGESGSETAMEPNEHHGGEVDDDDVDQGSTEDTDPSASSHSEHNDDGEAAADVFDVSGSESEGELFVEEEE